QQLSALFPYTTLFRSVVEAVGLQGVPEQGSVPVAELEQGRAVAGGCRGEADGDSARGLRRGVVGTQARRAAGTNRETGRLQSVTGGIADGRDAVSLGG